MIVKFILLLVALKLHDVLDKPIPPTLLFVIPLFVLGLFSGSAIIPLLFFSALSGALAFLYFWLLSWFPSGAKYYSIMLIGGVVLIAI
jgi:hypothetical protein